MTNIEQWQQENDRFLASQVAWLRTRFDSLSNEATQPTSQPKRAKNGKSIGPQADDLDDSTTRPALTHLANRLGLSAFEQNILLLCTAMELDTRIPGLCAEAQADASRTYPTFALAMSLFDSPAWDAMSPERPLRKLRLIEVNQPGATPLTAAALRADERIVNYIKGLNYLDDRITPLLLPFDAEAELTLPSSQEMVAQAIVGQLEQSTAEGRTQVPVVQIVGSDAASKQAVARRVAAMFGLELLRLPCELVPTDFHELETLLRLWDREHRLLPVAMYLDAAESDKALLERPSSPQSRFLARAGGLVFVDSTELLPAIGRPAIVFDVHKPTSAEQRDLWHSLLDDERTAKQLAGQFSLNAGMIHRVAKDVEWSTLSEESVNGTNAPMVTPPSTADSLDAMEKMAPPRHFGASFLDADQGGDTETLTNFTHPAWNACRRATRPRLDSLAQRIDARATWDDLVLPPEEARQLREVADQIQHRGRVYDDWGFRAKHNRGLGVSVLFAGESGTGKTMAAEVIANALKLDLYRIDLSAVVNKYIGETEKNLRRLFDAADDSGAILLFDEADSLFGKRTEVKDSHDRYANLEVNYLLQRMEAYRGLAILATNLRSSLDTAFLRRLRFIVNFPLPDVAQRRELWRKAFPSQLPIARLDLDQLARLNITGGNIHSIALNAAFATAHDGPELSMPHVLGAAKSEFRKLQKPINAADFRGFDIERNLS